ncbi:MAG: hypothetical protein R3F59_24635 [Myxococcota bacterium]
MPAAGRTFHLRASIGTLHEEYLAEEDGRPVAVVLVAADPPVDELRDALVARMDVLRGLRHAGCAVPREVLVLDGSLALLWPPPDGVTLDRLALALQRAGERLPPRAALDVGAQLADALRAAHTAEVDERPQPVVHGAVTPADVRLSPAGRVQLRFGTTGERAARGPRASSAGLVTADAWSAPEALLGRGGGPPGDVFSAALVCAEALTGRQLTPAPRRPEPHALWRDGVRGALSAAEIGGDPALEVLVRALALRPAERPTAAELANALDAASQALKGEDLAAFAPRAAAVVEERLGPLEQPTSGLLMEGPAGGTPVPALAAGAPPVALRRLWAVAGSLAAVSGLCGAGTMAALLATQPPSAAATGPAVVQVPGAATLQIACDGGAPVTAEGDEIELQAVGRGTCTVTARIGGQDRAGEVPMGAGVRARCAVEAGRLSCREVSPAR